MGPEANGPPTCQGTGGRRSPVLLMEGVQGSARRRVRRLHQGAQKSGR